MAEVGRGDWGWGSLSLGFWELPVPGSWGQVKGLWTETGVRH